MVARSPAAPRLRSSFRRHPMLTIGLAAVVLWLLIALLAPLISPYGPNTPDMTARFLAPSLHHLLGTDEYGRDILTRVFFGSRLSLFIAIASTGAAAALGVPIGVYAGFRGGLPGEILMRIMDVLLAFPSLVLALAIGAAIGPGLTGELLAITLVSIPTFARQAYAGTASVKNLPFIESAHSIGLATGRLIRRHVLPNISGPLLVIGTLNLGFAVLTGASLSFIGLGVPLPTAEWGSMVSDGSQYLVSGQWWPSLFPGLAIMTVVFAFNVAGDGLGDLQDPRSHGSSTAFDAD